MTSTISDRTASTLWRDRSKRPAASPAPLKGKTLFITGASRGIGKAIALRAARDGANVVIAAKTTEPHPKLAGHDLHGGRGDRGGRRQGAARASSTSATRSRSPPRSRRPCETFGGIDILVNNASAISLTGTLDDADEALRPDAPGQHARHVRVLAGVHPAPAKAANPHILNLSPPLNMEARWFAPHVAYTMAKYGMSMCVLGMAEEFSADGIAVNALWPRTAIATAAVQNLLGGDAMHARQPQARDHGRRGPRDPHAAEPRVHRQLLHRRRRARARAA